jgi:hypothetical protein
MKLRSFTRIELILSALVVGLIILSEIRTNIIYKEKDEEIKKIKKDLATSSSNAGILLGMTFYQAGIGYYLVMNNEEFSCYPNPSVYYPTLTLPVSLHHDAQRNDMGLYVISGFNAGFEAARHKQ